MLYGIVIPSRGRRHTADHTHDKVYSSTFTGGSPVAAMPRRRPTSSVNIATSGAAHVSPAIRPYRGIPATEFQDHDRCSTQVLGRQTFRRRGAVQRSFLLHEGPNAAASLRASTIEDRNGRTAVDRTSHFGPGLPLACRASSGSKRGVSQITGLTAQLCPSVTQSDCLPRIPLQLQYCSYPSVHR